MFGCFVIVDVDFGFCIAVNTWSWIRAVWHAMQSTSHAFVPPLHATNYTHVSKFTTIRMVFRRNVPKRIKFCIFNTGPSSRAHRHFIATKIFFSLFRQKTAEKLNTTAPSTFSLVHYEQASNAWAQRNTMQSEMYANYLCSQIEKHINFQIKCSLHFFKYN